MGTLWTLQSSQPGLSLHSKLPLAYGTSYYAISLSVNIILTILITFRLLLYRHRIKESLPEEHAKHYVFLLTIIIESAALYSLFSILFLITYAVNNPTNQKFFGMASSAQVSLPSQYSLHKLTEDHHPTANRWISYYLPGRRG